MSALRHRDFTLVFASRAAAILGYYLVISYELYILTDYIKVVSLEKGSPADGNFVFSFRHTDSIVKVDRHTAQILWTLGGKEDQFGLMAEQLFSHQHHARMHPDGTMTVFDNGNGLHQSRALQLTLDQANHKVLNFDVIYEKPTAQAATAFMGSVAPTEARPTYYSAP